MQKRIKEMTEKMATELEQEFYDTFGIEKIKDFNYCNGGIVEYYLKYPDITAEKLLEMICIWNYIIPCADDCIIPIDYLGLKSVVLDKMIRYSEIEYEFDVDALKYQTQQLFKED